MLAALFKSQPVVDEGTKNWIFDTFAWAVEHFESQVFVKETQLILPTNSYYPGSVSSVHEMAQAIFNNTLKYAGMQGWPIVLVAPQVYEHEPMPKLALPEVIRGQQAVVHINREHTSPIRISYHPGQINQPQDLIATFAHSLAMIMITQRGILPPGGKENLPQAADLLACFMGFGVMLANTAYQFKGGCGSCYNASANRQAALPEQDTLYMLALFSILKSIPIKTVTPHLKSHMKSTFKSAYKELVQLMKHSPYPALQAVRQ